MSDSKRDEQIKRTLGIFYPAITFWIRNQNLGNLEEEEAKDEFLGFLFVGCFLITGKKNRGLEVKGLYNKYY